MRVCRRRLHYRLRQGWSKGRPMDVESGMVEQAARLVAANPAQKVGVYRNIIAAQPWVSKPVEEVFDRHAVAVQ